MVASIMVGENQRHYKENLQTSHCVINLSFPKHNAMSIQLIPWLLLERNFYYLCWGRLCKIMVVEQAHLLVDEVVKQMRAGTVPLYQPTEQPTEHGSQVSCPVVCVQTELQATTTTTFSTQNQKTGFNLGLKTPTNLLHLVTFPECFI